MNVFDAAYLAYLLPLSPVLAARSLTDARFRESLPERLGRLPTRPGRGGIWFHAASVGEVNVLKPLVAEIRRRDPGLAFAVTTLTPSGRDNALNAFPNEPASYAPIDFSWCVREAGRRWRPDLLAIVEQELWPNMILQSRAPVVLVNGRITARSAGLYRRVRGVFARIVRRFERIFVQNELYRERYVEMGADPGRVAVTGNLKFDGAPRIDVTEQRELHRALLNLTPESMVIVGGSTHPPEEEALADAFRGLSRKFKDLRLVLAPRHLERVPEVMGMLEARRLAALRLSDRLPQAIAPVTVIDQMGKLVPAYSVATVVFVGGTLGPRGGQNLIEPAALGRPIVTGPSLENFRDVAEALAAADAVRIVPGRAALEPALAELLSNPERLVQMALSARRTVDSAKGAAGRVAEELVRLAAARRSGSFENCR